MVAQWEVPKIVSPESKNALMTAILLACAMFFANAVAVADDDAHDVFHLGEGWRAPRDSLEVAEELINRDRLDEAVMVFDAVAREAPDRCGRTCRWHRGVALARLSNRHLARWQEETMRALSGAEKHAPPPPRAIGCADDPLFVDAAGYRCSAWRRGYRGDPRKRPFCTNKVQAPSYHSRASPKACEAR